MLHQYHTAYTATTPTLKKISLVGLPKGHVKNRNYWCLFKGCSYKRIKVSVKDTRCLPFIVLIIYFMTTPGWQEGREEREEKWGKVKIVSSDVGSKGRGTVATDLTENINFYLPLDINLILCRIFTVAPLDF
jgi:hypothetical protein